MGVRLCPCIPLRLLLTGLAERPKFRCGLDVARYFFAENVAVLTLRMSVLMCSLWYLLTIGCFHLLERLGRLHVGF